MDALHREYPSALRHVGIEATALINFFVSEAGSVENALLAIPSGYSEVEDAALRLARQFEFRAAVDGERHVAAWVQIPITFPPNAMPCAPCAAIPPAEPLTSAC